MSAFWRRMPTVVPGHRDPCRDRYLDAPCFVDLVEQAQRYEVEAIGHDEIAEDARFGVSRCANERRLALYCREKAAVLRERARG